MHAGSEAVKTDGISPDHGHVGTSSVQDNPARSIPLQPISTPFAFPDFSFHLSSQTRGWAVKAYEFIKSGPPALLNNPRCSRRVLVFNSTYAMEVHYG